MRSSISKPAIRCVPEFKALPEACRADFAVGGPWAKSAFQIGKTGRILATLISFAGLPGTGKSTISRALSAATGAVYLRIDEIDAAIWAIDPDRDIGPESYHIAAALAASNLALGHTTIIDCVNPWDVTREIFIAAAMRCHARFLGVEAYCSDLATHRARVEKREMDVPGLDKPDWKKVLARDYRPWAAADVKLDTAKLNVAEAVSEIERYL